MLCGLYFLSFAIWTHDDIRAFESDQVLGSTRQTQVLGSSCDHPRQPSAEKTVRTLAFIFALSCALLLRLLFPPPVQWCSTCFVQDHFLALCYTIFFLPYEIAILFVLHYFFSFPATIFFLPCALRLSYPAQRYFSLLCYAIFFFSAALFFYLFLPCATIFLFLLFIFFLSLQCATLLLSLPYTIMYFLLRCTMFSFLLPSAFFFSDCYHCSAQYNLFSFPLLIFFLSCTALFLRISLAS